ncbi:NIPSNAP family protein [Chelativorans salis]|uniref:NIPSNAP family protein n=1 Tax=Chelativorans salis TaxID=2978478 RepID=A0ABT2LJQ9_9HYPH|nr:NIPSNAP family protein [Chelativorans sp. EGI FJ00035]MCT7374830.1 NIPSNAP family protein [Chelativorans sp. EGI FJ00035]
MTALPTDNPATPPFEEQDPRQAVVELRSYRLHTGQRDTLIALFDREFVESQEACGMSVLGQFRDLDRPDEFVWLRGFADMETRRAALTAFYDGPVWAEHRNAANATMIDSDNVLLLKPADHGAGFDLAGVKRPRPGSSEGFPAVYAVYVFPLALHRVHSFPAYFSQSLMPALTEAGAPAGACFVTEQSTNTFPRLPVRENERVFVWIARFDSAEAHAAFTTHLAETRGWRAALESGFDGCTAGPAMRYRLSPTARSLLR